MISCGAVSITDIASFKCGKAQFGNMSDNKVLPLGQGDRAAGLVCLTVDEVAF